jgi:hypothetical protein
MSVPRWRLSNNGNCFPISCYGDVSAFAMASIIVTCSWNKVLVPVLPISPLLVYLKPANFTMTKILASF